MARQPAFSLLPLFALALLTAWSDRPLGAQQRSTPSRGAPPDVADSVKVIADIPYAGTENPRQTLSLVLPADRTEAPLPVIVFVHGGAWRAGNKNQGLPRILEFVKSGAYAGVTVGYRLSGEAQWPAQIHDCKAAIRWIRAHAKQHGLAADRIGVWGSSAGGHLVAMLGTSGEVQAMEGGLGPHTDVSSRVRCVVDFFGPTDFLQMNAKALPGSRLDHDAASSPESLLIGGPIQQNRQRVAAANPLTYVTADDPPFLIVHGTRDPLVPFHQSELLHRRLKQERVSSVLVTVDGGGHGRGFGREVNEEVAKFLAHHLRGQPLRSKDRTLPAAGIRRRP